MAHLIPHRRPPARADWPYVPDRAAGAVFDGDPRSVLNWAGVWLAASTAESNLTSMFASDMLVRERGGGERGG